MSVKNRSLLFLFLFFSGICPILAQVATEATFEPDAVTEGENSIYRLTITMEGNRRLDLSSVRPPSPPEVEGLRFRYIGPRTQIVTTNGETTANFSFLYEVRTSEPGTFEVPTFQIGDSQRRLTIPSAELEVLERESPSGDEENLPQDRAVWLEYELPRENVYVGESVPLKVRLFVNNTKVIRASMVTEGPEKIGDAFSIGDSGSASQRQVRRGDAILTVAEWEVLVTPLKTGAQPLLFELPLQVSLRDRGNRPRSRFDSMFGPSLFDQMFASEMVRAYSENRDIEILPLPTEGQPADFSGGIGNFAVEDTSLSSSEVRVGEPFLYSISISGEGNFDRLESPVLAGGEEDWRLYDPETSFSPEDEQGYSGTKTFTFTLAARSEAQQSTPPFSLSYFSPEEGEYKTVDIPPRPLSVLPAPPGSRRPVSQNGDTNPVEVRRGPDLLPIVATWPGSKASLRNPLLSPSFLAVQILLGIALILSWAGFRHRAKLRNDSNYARSHRSKKQTRLALAAAARSSAAADATGFYRAACRCLREAVGPGTAGDPESLTETEVLAALPDDFDDREREECGRFFEVAESIDYGARNARSADLPKDLNRLRALIRRISSGRQRRTKPGPLPLLLLCLLISGGFFPRTTEASEHPVSDPKGVFGEAISQYEAGEYGKAAENFSRIARSHLSAPLLYNLGNSYYRLRDYPKAILSYERALLLDPNNPDVRKNLDLTREAASLEAPPPPPLASIGFRFSWGFWVWFTVLGLWGLVAVLVLSRPLFWSGIWRNTALLLCTLVLGISLIGQVPWFLTRNDAIVLTRECPLRLAPTATSPLETRLQAGVTIEAGGVHGEYTRVRTEDDLTGWVLTNSMQRIRQR